MTTERPPGTIWNAHCGAQVETPRGVATCTDHGLGHYDPAMNLSWPAGQGPLVAGFDAAPTPPECDPERVETVARALAEACRRLAFSDDAEPWPSEDDLRTLAAAAIDADPSPAEEAVKRVEAVLARAYPVVGSRVEGTTMVVKADSLRAALASPAPAPCWCIACEHLTVRARTEAGDPLAMFARRFIVCPDCGNKRCPRATHHDLPCTGSNEPGQPGSAYEQVVAPPVSAEELRARILDQPAPRDRYAQCDDTCTVDCGACKGAGRPAPAPQGESVCIHGHAEDDAHVCGEPR